MQRRTLFATAKALSTDVAEWKTKCNSIWLSISNSFFLFLHDLSLAQLVSQFSGQPVSKSLLNASFWSPQIHGKQIIDNASGMENQRVCSQSQTHLTHLQFVSQTALPSRCQIKGVGGGGAGGEKWQRRNSSD